MLRRSLLILFFVSAALHAENWAQFRGPQFNGFSPETNLPASWSQKKNVVWATELPGASAASPIIWEDRVFISSADPANDALLAMCLDRKTGNVMWKQVAASGVRRDSRSNYAGPTPVTDGDVVIFFYGNGPLVAYDLNGDVRWKRNIAEDYGEFAFLWTFSSSPLLHNGKLYLQVLQRDTAVDGRGFSDRVNDSYLLALDPKTGEEVFQVVRPSNAVRESREAFTTPIPFTYQGRDEILVIGGDALTGHDPDTGEELWRWGTWNPERIGHWRLVPSPVTGNGVILACAPKGSPIYAIKAGGNGILTDDAVVWDSSDENSVSSDVPTPAFAYGDFFVLNKGRKTMLRLQPKTGAVQWQTTLARNETYEASPLVADGKVYVIDHSGRVVVLDAENGDKLHTIEMDSAQDDPTRSSIVAAQGQLFIRTTTKLFCIAKP